TMSSMFKKKTGPSIKPKLVPRGRPATSSATPAPAQPPSTAATSTPTPQQTAPAEAPSQRVTSPQAQRRVSVANASKAPETSPPQGAVRGANDQVPSTNTWPSTASHTT